MKALIAAGGKGTRLQPITFTHNKQLIPIANKPTIQYGLENIRDAGITEVIMNVNPGDSAVEKFFGDGNAFGLNITYVEQKGGPLGVAHVILNAKELLRGSNFVFYLGDNIVLGGIGRFIKKFQEGGLNCLLTLAKVPDPTRFGIAEIAKDGRLVRVVEKPAQPPSDFAVAGIYVYDHHVFEAFDVIKPSVRGELEISDVNSFLIERGYKVGYEIIDGYWKDTGKPQDLLEGNQLVLNSLRGREIYGILDKDVVLEGAIRVGKGTCIKNGGRKTVIRGPVVIGENCTIENSHIAPYTSIGDNCKIIGSEIAHSILFDDVEVSMKERLVDSIVGTGARISCAEETFPIGHRLLVGDNSSVEI